MDNKIDELSTQIIDIYNDSELSTTELVDVQCNVLLNTCLLANDPMAAVIDIATTLQNNMLEYLAKNPEKLPGGLGQLIKALTESDSSNLDMTELDSLLSQTPTPPKDKLN